MRLLPTPTMFASSGPEARPEQPVGRTNAHLADRPRTALVARPSQSASPGARGAAHSASEMGLLLDEGTGLVAATGSCSPFVDWRSVTFLFRLHLLLVVLLLVVSACSSSQSASFEECPITPPLGGVPDEVVDYQRPVPWVKEDAGWYGNSALWVSLPPDGVLPSLPSVDDPVLFDTKFPWWRLSSGMLEVRTAKVGVGEAFIERHVPDGYGEGGFVPSSLLFSSEGCWQVTGVVDGVELRFVVWVCETDGFPADVPSHEREACGAIRPA